MAVGAPRRALVVGAGIAGLTAAYRLRRLDPAAAITIIEAEERLGGKVLTERRGGFVIEGGPDSFLTLKPWGLALCRELGLESRLHGADGRARRSYVLWRGRLHEFPEGMSGLVPARLGPLFRSALLSPLGKIRLAMEWIVPRRRGDADESLASFLRRRLGRQAYERLAEPLMAGIFAGDGESLSLPATFPALREMEASHGSLLRALRAARRGEGRGAASGPAAGWPAFVTLEGGLAEIIDALHERLERVEVRRGSRVTSLRRTASGYEAGFERHAALAADAVILATPAFVGAGLLSDLDPDLAGALRAIPHVSTATVSLAYPRSALARPLDGAGYVVPRAEGREVVACTWVSSKFPHRAPEGCALIRVFVGRSGRESLLERGDEALVEEVRRDLRPVLGVSAPPIFSRVHRWPLGMPQYTLGHRERLETIDRRLAAHPGLFVAGACLRGVGLPDCIRSGEEAAEAAAAWLARRPDPVH